MIWLIKKFQVDSFCGIRHRYAFALTNLTVMLLTLIHAIVMIAWYVSGNLEYLPNFRTLCIGVPQILLWISAILLFASVVFCWFTEPSRWSLIRHYVWIFCFCVHLIFWVVYGIWIVVRLRNFYNYIFETVPDNAVTNVVVRIAAEQLPTPFSELFFMADNLAIPVICFIVIPIFMHLLTGFCTFAYLAVLAEGGDGTERTCGACIRQFYALSEEEQDLVRCGEMNLYPDPKYSLYSSRGQNGSSEKYDVVPVSFRGSPAPSIRYVSGKKSANFQSVPNYGYAPETRPLTLQVNNPTAVKSYPVEGFISYGSTGDQMKTTIKTGGEESHSLEFYSGPVRSANVQRQYQSQFEPKRNETMTSSLEYYSGPVRLGNGSRRVQSLYEPRKPFVPPAPNQTPPLKRTPPLPRYEIKSPEKPESVMAASMLPENKGVVAPYSLIRQPGVAPAGMGSNILDLGIVKKATDSRRKL